VGYKVWRTTKTNTERTQFKYGGGVDKLTQYRVFWSLGIPSLEFTEDSNVVQDWLNEGYTVVGRKLLNASCGKGIVIIEPEDEAFVSCPVYTKYKKKKREFRVHVFKDQVVSIVEKRKRREFDGQRDTKIRNVANGYVFCQEVENIPEGLQALAIAAAQVSPSDFRGVDIGFNELNNELFVLEVNSAPGIEGTNLIKYTEKVLNYVQHTIL
jgi:glutathione synthase/RimK-type ligase-like ATP-grasp enzyme